LALTNIIFNYILQVIFALKQSKDPFENGVEIFFILKVFVLGL
tara:strand:+ start:196 stop:324 length:129 start_codon:yes stop_codon:yes gene_type:complete